MLLALARRFGLAPGLVLAAAIFAVSALLVAGSGPPIAANAAATPAGATASGAPRYPAAVVR